jgi:ABC-type xylose transport system permease subunit
MRAFNKFLLRVFTGLLFAVLYAIAGILGGSICGLILGALLSIAMIPYNKEVYSTGITDNSIIVCQLIGGLIGAVAGFTKGGNI